MEVPEDIVEVSITLYLIRIFLDQLFLIKEVVDRANHIESLDDNNTENIVDDIEFIRDFFQYKKFIIVGGSWGSTLCLKYAIKYPDKLIGVLLRAVFLGTMSEIEWAFINGPKVFAPNLYELYGKS